MKIFFVSFLFVFVSSLEVINDNDSSSSPPPKPKPKPSPSPPSPSPTLSPTEFNYCFHWGFHNFEQCGDDGIYGYSFCLNDVEGSPHCFSNALCNNLPPCSSSSDCPTNYLCTSICNSTVCSPLCGSVVGPIDAYFADAPYYPDTTTRCFDQSDTPLNHGVIEYSENMKGTSLGSGLKSQQQLEQQSEQQSFLLTHLNVIVFASLGVVVVVGTFFIVISSRLSQQPKQAIFHEISTMESVDRASFVPKSKSMVVELERATLIPSKREISEIQL